MKKAAVFTCTAILAIAGTARGEDAPWSSSYKDYNWQGIYFGVNAGYGWGTDSTTEMNNGGGDTGFSADFDQRGGVEGFQVGYNIPLGQRVIFGADVDWDNADISGGYRRLANGNGDDVKYDWLSSIRARIGMPYENILPYIAGGFTMADIKDDFIAGNTAAQDLSTVRFGWTIGAGLEVGLPENFSARLDYRYIDFASYNQTPSIVLPGLSYRQSPNINEVTAGISYYFK